MGKALVSLGRTRNKRTELTSRRSQMTHLDTLRSLFNWNIGLYIRSVLLLLLKFFSKRGTTHFLCTEIHVWVRLSRGTNLNLISYVSNRIQNSISIFPVPIFLLNILRAE
jgi:hypothetical protein